MTFEEMNTIKTVLFERGFKETPINFAFWDEHNSEIVVVIPLQLIYNPEMPASALLQYLSQQAFSRHYRSKAVKLAYYHVREAIERAIINLCAPPRPSAPSYSF